jgi:hypothetical protein
MSSIISYVYKDLVVDVGNVAVCSQGSSEDASDADGNDINLKHSMTLADLFESGQTQAFFRMEIVNHSLEVIEDSSNSFMKQFLSKIPTRDQLIDDDSVMDLMSADVSGLFLSQNVCKLISSQAGSQSLLKFET